MFLLSLISAALAFDVRRTEELAARLAEIEGRAAGPVVIAGAGSDAWRQIQKMQGGSPPPTWTAVRVPLMGDVDREMAQVLAQSGRVCAVRVAKTGVEGEWFISEHGVCGQAQRAESGWIPEVAALAAGASEASATTSNPLSVEGSPTGDNFAEPAPLVVAVARDDMAVVLLQHTVPNPTTALLSSALVGFGAGHFYANDDDQGWMHLGLQASGLVVFGLGRLIAEGAWTDLGRRSAMGMAWVGVGLTVGSRLVDTATAPDAAHDEARRQIELQLR